MSRTIVRKACELPRFHTRDRPKSFDHDTNMLHRAQAYSDREHDSEQPHYVILQRADSMLERSMDWSLKVIGAGCAVIFGIWAPLAYQLQKEGNAGDDAAQQEIKELRDEVAELSAQMRMLGMLRAWEVCEGDDKMDLPACRYLASTMPLNKVIAQLASASTNNLTVPVDAPAPDTSSSSGEAATTSESASVIVSVTKVLTPVPPRTSSFDHYDSMTYGVLHDELDLPSSVIDVISDVTYIRPDTGTPLTSTVIGYMDGIMITRGCAYLCDIQGGGDGSVLLWLLLSVLITIVYVLQPGMQFVRERRKTMKGS